MVEVYHLQARLRASGDCTRNGCHHSKQHPGQQEVLSVQIFQGLARSKRHDKPDRSHGEESESSITSGELIHLLGHQDNVVDDILIASISS